MGARGQQSSMEVVPVDGGGAGERERREADAERCPFGIDADREGADSERDTEWSIIQRLLGANFILILLILAIQLIFQTHLEML